VRSGSRSEKEGYGSRNARFRYTVAKPPEFFMAQKFYA
jgi:hypothetical protein